MKRCGGGLVLARLEPGLPIGHDGAIRGGKSGFLREGRTG